MFVPLLQLPDGPAVAAIVSDQGAMLRVLVMRTFDEAVPSTPFADAVPAVMPVKETTGEAIVAPILSTKATESTLVPAPVRYPC